MPSPVLVATGNTKSSVPLASSGSSQLDGKAEHRSLWNTLEVSLKWVRAWGSGVQR